ncbi:MAG: YcaO-like family protein [Alphaproteobacteria bacterium]|nr:YcaO-like family protein [Alphaproteobacteria bacterium]
MAQYIPDYRATSPEETLKRITPYLKDMGITRLANVTGLDQIGIPVYLAFRPNSRSLSISQGKGISPAHAKVSALMETIESHHGETIEIERILASINQVECGQYSLCDYNGLVRYKGKDLNHHKAIEWILGQDLISNTERLVPYLSVHVDMRAGSLKQDDVFLQSSNGLASGNTTDEAIAHAMCELIERDAYACWFLSNTQHQTKINLRTINADSCNALIQKFYTADTHVGIWDMTSDTGIPCFIARIIPKDPPDLCPIRPASGFGCHPNKELALTRALTEAAQSRLTFIAGARDDIHTSNYDHFISSDEYNKWHRSIVEQPAFTDYTDILSFEIKHPDDIGTILKKRLLHIGIEEIITVDLTKRHYGIPVVKVLIPHLEGGAGYSVMNCGRRANKVLEARLSKKVA